MPTVFISNMNPKHNYAPATRHGSIRPVTQGNYPVFKTDRLMEEIVVTLLDSDPEDFLVLSGAAMIASMCLTVWLLLHKRAKILLHDPKQDTYVPRIITRDELIMTIEELRDRKNANV